MITLLEENISTEKRSNIARLQKRWEQVDVDSELRAPFGAVIAAFSLGMSDIRKAIEKMIRVCKGCIALYWLARVPTWTSHYATLYPILHGRPYHPSPKSRVLIGVLKQMGIDPAVEFMPTAFPIRFCSMGEAIDELSPEFNARTEYQKTILADYLERILILEEESLVVPHSYMAFKMWWKSPSNLGL